MSVAESTGPVPQAEVAALFERCDLHLAYERRVLAAWREGFARGREAGWQDGYARAHAERDALWREFARPVADPQRYERESAARRIRAAEAGCRRDAAEWEREFVARAFATPAHMRTDVQRATVQSYPPPARRSHAA
jgi:hypothetical protein